MTYSVLSVTLNSTVLYHAASGIHKKSAVCWSLIVVVGRRLCAVPFWLRQRTCICARWLGCCEWRLLAHSCRGTHQQEREDRCGRHVHRQGQRTWHQRCPQPRQQWRVLWRGGGDVGARFWEHSSRLYRLSSEDTHRPRRSSAARQLVCWRATEPSWHRIPLPRRLHSWSVTRHFFLGYQSEICCIAFTFSHPAT